MKAVRRAQRALRLIPERAEPRLALDVQQPGQLGFSLDLALRDVDTYRGGYIDPFNMGGKALMMTVDHELWTHAQEENRRIGTLFGGCPLSRGRKEAR